MSCNLVWDMSTFTSDINFDLKTWLLTLNIPHWKLIGQIVFKLCGMKFFTLNFKYTGCQTLDDTKRGKHKVTFFLFLLKVDWDGKFCKIICRLFCKTCQSSQTWRCLLSLNVSCRFNLIHIWANYIIDDLDQTGNFLINKTYLTLIFDFYTAYSLLGQRMISNNEFLATSLKCSIIWQELTHAAISGIPVSVMINNL